MVRYQYLINVLIKEIVTLPVDFVDFRSDPVRFSPMFDPGLPCIHPIFTGSQPCKVSKDLAVVNVNEDLDFLDWGMDQEFPLVAIQFRIHLDDCMILPQKVGSDCPCSFLIYAQFKPYF